MTIVEMLQQSTVLTVLGMTVVFLFLWLMIICVNVVGRLVHKLGWDKDIEQPHYDAPQNTSATAKSEVPADITAAISAAVAEYRKEGGDL